MALVDRVEIFCNAVMEGNSPMDSKHLIVARSLTTAKRNVLTLLEQLVGTGNFTYSVSQKEGL